MARIAAAIVLVLACLLAPARASIDYMVFFDRGDATLTVEALMVIGDYVQLVRSYDDSSFEVGADIYGHTDAPEEVLDKTLSLRRAQAVRDELIRRGIPAERIRISARGNSDPMVLTPDPQNRRALMFIAEWPWQKSE